MKKIFPIIFSIIYYGFLLIALILASMLFMPSAYAQSLTVAWDANTEPDLNDYTIYQGEQSGSYTKTYKLSLNPAGRNVLCPEPYDPFKSECCEFTIPDLEDGKTYYFAATASDKDNNESAYSDELVHTVVIPESTEKSTQLRKAIEMKKIEK